MNKLTSVILAIFCGFLVSRCGYKAPPSPLLDEQERFAPLIEKKSKESTEQEQSASPGVFNYSEPTTVEDHRESDNETSKDRGEMNKKNKP